MKILLLITLLLLPAIVFAKTDCVEEAKHLVNDLENEIPGMLGEHREQAVMVLQKACENRLGFEHSAKKDAFTELLLSGEGGDKPGNKRLKRLK